MRGFTLIEAVVVTAIVLTLGSVVAASLSKAKTAAETSEEACTEFRYTPMSQIRAVPDSCVEFYQKQK